MECSACSRVAPIEDRGIVTVRSGRPEMQHKINGHVKTGGSFSPVTYRYESQEELLGKLHELQLALSPEEREEVLLTIAGGHGQGEGKPAAVSLNHFFARLENHGLVRLIMKADFTSHMQPIVEMETGEVFAYEFLLRAAEDGPSFQPYQLFRTAQATGLHSFLDRAARISAIEVSARHLSPGTKRFVNFLPSSIYNPNYCLSHTFAAIDRCSLDPADFVFEVVETERIEDIAHLRSIFKVYREHGMKVALDDVGSGFPTLEVLTALQPDFVKIDRGLVNRCDQDEGKQERIREILERAASFGASVLTEGMERREEWEYCRSAGIRLAQGYLLGKPAAAPLARGARPVPWL
ncbi:EAL domain-containing protein (putative c-di-GMP-specific phosphodiesterase class I) [Paenibacillus mucilaginosus]|uniref:EAL domain-containing protein n=1 Tax=Paenibacillus mucilaginosus TaxID=61624 RepID=UPI003D19B27C